MRCFTRSDLLVLLAVEILIKEGVGLVSISTFLPASPSTRSWILIDKHVPESRLIIVSPSSS